MQDYHHHHLPGITKDSLTGLRLADASSMIQPFTLRILSGMAVLLDDFDRSIIVTSESTFHREFRESGWESI